MYFKSLPLHVNPELPLQPVRPLFADKAEGAMIVGVSSNRGDSSLDGSFGGNKAIDGNASSEWSSNGYGERAWVEIEFSQSFDLTALGFWTRTMGNSAQIFRFSVVVDVSQRLGPFDVPDAAAIYYFDVQVPSETPQV